MSMPAPLPVVESIVRKLGGPRALGAEVRSEADLAQLVLHGIRPRVLGFVEEAGFTRREIETYVIPARTLRHRTTRREPLTIDESDRLVRLARIQAVAEDVFGDAAKANRWLREPLGILGGKSPLDFARSDPGARVIEQILARIDWGAAA
jgi:putative toxin-antitoxin system antitoxin component (TIGR02293 family)